MLFPISRYPRKINGATDTFPHICGWGPGGKDGLLHLARRNQSVRIKTREEAEVLRGPLRLPPQHPLCLRLSLRAPRGRCGPSGLGLGAVGPSLSRLRPCLSGCRAATASEELKKKKNEEVEKKRKKKRRATLVLPFLFLVPGALNIDLITPR